MQCPHCTVEIHEDWYCQRIYCQTGDIKKDQNKYLQYRSTLCPACKKYIVESYWTDQFYSEIEINLITPKHKMYHQISNYVPEELRELYNESTSVLQISPKASAALSRRCLQTILHDEGYRDRDLSKEIDLILNETNPQKAIPLALRQTIDAIRNFGNFSAHPIDDKTTLQIIDVEPEEAEWCLEIIRQLFEHFYVAPAIALQKKAALDLKLAAAGKPPTK